MQINSIVLYNAAGDTRVLPFKTGKVNIITGESKTGKTAIIDIINYCLGSDDCKISEGVIRETVTWFAIKVQLQSEQMFIARQNPSFLNLASTSHIYFENADIVKTPVFTDLINNSNIDTLKSVISRKLGIGEYLNNPPEGATRDALAVNFKHSRFYSFQPQYLIAQRDYLFFNQTEPFVPQSIKDTLPYFLGAVREDSIKIEQSINSKKRALTRLIKDYKENTRVKDEGSKKLYELIEEAKQVNLLPSNLTIESNDSAISELRKVLEWDINQNDEISGDNENLKNLLEEKNSLQKKLTNIIEDVNAAKSFEIETSSYQSEVGQQKIRLESINLFKETEADLHSCPLCDNKVTNEVPSISAINDTLRSLSNNLQTTQAEAPRINKYIEGLMLQKDSLVKEIEIKNNSIKSLYIEQENANRIRELNVRKGRVIGRVSLMLESYDEVEIDNTFEVEIDQLSKEIEALEELISPDEKELLLNAALNKINTQMTKWKDKLDLEYGDSPIRFDLKKLTLFADTPQKSIPLSNMGSGANWVAYHLLIHFALHKLFIQDKRPTPNFLIIDQPSQVYFPPDRDLTNDGDISQSSDEKAVHQMFDFILEITKELSPNFQVIITDHTNQNNDDFQSAIVEEWRGGQKLIPQNWITN